MFCKPLAGWREARVREQRTKIDWAQEMQRFLSIRYAGVEKLIVVCDNLNTHTKGAFYEAFPASEAREPARRRVSPYVSVLKLTSYADAVSGG